jgi:hypothetical protein
MHCKGTSLANIDTICWSLLDTSTRTAFQEAVAFQISAAGKQAKAFGTVRAV